jgi:aminopeptidase N
MIFNAQQYVKNTFQVCRRIGWSCAGAGACQPYTAAVMLARATTIGFLLLLASTSGYADTYPRQPGVDAIHYLFHLGLDDTSDRIAGEATITFRLADGVNEVTLDLTSAANGKGMMVSAVAAGGRPVTFTHAANRLRIPLAAKAPSGQDLTVVVTYAGIPAGGLRLLQNIHGERTIFSENWPDHARQWLPMIDHPYDKATGEFVVTAPAHYQVVANGLLVEESDLPGGMRRTHWKQSVPIASWLFALGVARFSVHHYDVVRGIPQQVWVFPQDRDQGYKTFEFTGRNAFEFFSDRIGRYSYEKLAHIEAAGMSGGTEHASSIFYGEKGVTVGRAPVVHEVAHQWFGDSITEKDWDEVWLSEGFATYFTHLYTEQFGGRDAFVQGLRADVQTIINAQNEAPEQSIIHRNLADMSKVLNRFVYQKAGWVLHMLRGLIGTDAFWSGIREYYRRYRNLNASTDDLRQVMEQAAGTPLSWFFDQWLKRPGMPSLHAAWRYDAAARQVQVDVAQTQKGDAFRFPLEIGIAGGAGLARVERVEMTRPTGTFRFAADAAPTSVTLDPNTWLLVQSVDVVNR